MDDPNVPTNETVNQPSADVEQPNASKIENVNVFVPENASNIAETDQTKEEHENVGQSLSEIAPIVDVAEQSNVPAIESSSRSVNEETSTVAEPTVDNINQVANENASSIHANEQPNGISPIENLTEVNSMVTSGTSLSFGAFTSTQSFAGFQPTAPTVSYSPLFGAHSMSTGLFAPHHNYGSFYRDDYSNNRNFSPMFGQYDMNGMSQGPLGSMQNHSLIDQILIGMPPVPPYAHNFSSAFGAMTQYDGSMFPSLFSSSVSSSASNLAFQTASGINHDWQPNQNQPVTQYETIEISDTENTPPQPAKRIKHEPIKLEPLNETISRRLDFLENQNKNLKDKNKNLAIHCEALQKKLIDQRKPDGTWEPVASSTINDENVDPFASSFNDFEN